MAAETVAKGFGLARPGWHASLAVAWTVFVARLRIITRYKGAILLESFLPIFFAAMPILLGIAVAGSEENAASNFFQNTQAAGQGTMEYRVYMLLGSSTFMVVSLMLWLIGYWVRREQETGTLESIYLAPAKRLYVLVGVTSYSLVRSLAAFIVAMFVGSLLFGVNPLAGNFLAAIGYLMLGIPALWGLSFFFGALIMRVKEANSVIQLIQWVVPFFMGIYFPVTMFPPLVRITAMAFPPTLMNDAMRSALLNIPSLYGPGYIVLGLMFMAAWITPLLGYEFFGMMERRIKRNEGVGQY
ncbi:MAG TPA: ABC transporter permease [Thermoplasmata archaeon]